MLKILCIVGARPNFMKIAPLLSEMKKNRRIRPILVHTGQHYDYELSKVFFEELDIPAPDYNLEVGAGSHALQTARVIERIEPVILKEKPDLMMVVGDVNSTLAAALTAAKLYVPVAHVEAGLRSFDKRMPEEINRKITDHLSDFLFCTEPAGVKNLLNEGISKKKIFLAGNVMIDTLLKIKMQKSKCKMTVKNSKLFSQLKQKEYAVLTLHRPKNVDDPKIFGEIMEAITEIQKQIKIIWPIHPRAKRALDSFFDANGVGVRYGAGVHPHAKSKLLARGGPRAEKHLQYLQQLEHLEFVKPLGYLEMLNLMKNAKFVMTDSGGIQEETTVLKIPCLTLRENTERPITIEVGTNILCGVKKEKIIKEALKILSGKQKTGRIPKFWDGKTSARIIKIITDNFSHK